MIHWSEAKGFKKPNIKENGLKDSKILKQAYNGNWTINPSSERIHRNSHLLIG